MNFQVADVTRPLLSVGRICDTGEYGKQVVFGRSGGVIIDLETGEATPFGRDEIGMYQLEFWMRTNQNSCLASPGFPGQGA